MKESQIEPKLALEQINKNNKDVDRDALSVLINYKTKEYFIGDSVHRLRHLKLIRNYFLNAKIIINVHHRIDFAILQNNPYINQLAFKDLSLLKLSEYDLIITIGDDRNLFTELIKSYSSELREKTFKTGVFSLTRYLKIDEGENYILPLYKKLHDFIVDEENLSRLEKEIFILNEEKEWANQWFRMKGVKSNEKVIVIVDSTSLREKLLPLEVHFEIVRFFLENESHKILVFDESGIGKSFFYNEWLTDKFKHRLIFAEKLKFRQELTLLSSDYIKFIFGPCTGIMHCASAIHNVSVSKYGKAKEPPGIMVYAGEDITRNLNKYLWWHKSYWWGDDEVAKCCVLKYVGDKRKEIVWINPNIHGYLPCSEYSSMLLQNFIKAKF